MLILKCVKLIILGSLSFTISIVALSSGILFGGYLIAAAYNPTGADKLYTQTLIFFALLETFVFLAGSFLFIVYKFA